MQLALIVICVVSARTAAMAFNRVVDRQIDAENLRTKLRELPSGQLSVWSAKLLVVFSTTIFLLATSGLGLICLYLSPVVLVIIFGYSYTKRFTSLAHIILGAALALAPGGAWFAVWPEFSLAPLPLMLAVVFWVSGFDILYSCQDLDFDRQRGLFSIPSKYGISNAFFISRLLHVLAVIMLFVFGINSQLGSFYWLGISLFAFFLIRQHWQLRDQDLSKINQIFFANNGWASLVLCLAVGIDRVW